MAALKWVVYSACHILGYPKDTNSSSDHHMATTVGYPSKEQANGDVKSLKVPTNVAGLSCKAGAVDMNPSGFQMPLHYPRYSKADYEKMEEWKLDLLLKQYGLDYKGTLDEKREYAKGAFLWPDQY